MTIKQQIGLNEQIAVHARMAKGWRHQDKAEVAYAVFDSINAKLYAGQLPTPLIGFDDSGRLKKQGEYYYEGDALSLKLHFDMRKDLSLLDTVITLLHNSVHLQAEIYGANKKTWYHTKAFRDAMLNFGLECDKSGDTKRIRMTEFTHTLKSIGQAQLLDVLLEGESLIEAEVTEQGEAEGEGEPKVVGQPEIVEFVASKATPSNGTKSQKGKLKRWACACTNIWAAVAVDYTCNKCGQDADLDAKAGAGYATS